MSYRFMRVILFFDLPTLSAEDRHNYAQFIKLLKHNGFVMMQESVYSRVLLNATQSAALMETLHKNKPPAGLVQVLTITEKQFARMEYLVGEAQSEVLDNTERLVFL